MCYKYYVEEISMFGGLKLFFDMTYGISHLKSLVEDQYIELPTEEREEKIQIMMDKIIESALDTAGYMILE